MFLGYWNASNHETFFDKDGYAHISFYNKHPEILSYEETRYGTDSEGHEDKLFNILSKCIGVHIAFRDFKLWQYSIELEFFELDGSITHDSWEMADEDELRWPWLLDEFIGHIDESKIKYIKDKLRGE